MVPTAGAPKKYIKIDGEWGYNDLEPVEATGGKTPPAGISIGQPTFNKTDTVIPAGKGIWFINGNETKKSINL